MAGEQLRDPPRYSARWASARKVEILDARHGGIVGAFVTLRRTVDGEGWHLSPLTVSRTSSRKLHATPQDAIASMRYMKRADAQAALAGGPPIDDDEG